MSLGWRDIWRWAITLDTSTVLPTPIVPEHQRIAVSLSSFHFRKSGSCCSHSAVAGTRSFMACFQGLTWLMLERLSLILDFSFAVSFFVLRIRHWSASAYSFLVTW